MRSYLAGAREPDHPNLITHVETTSATAADVTALDDIHGGLAEKGLLPTEHLVDSAHMSAFELVKGRGRGVKLVGPMRVGTSRQVADPDAFELARFDIDWEAERVTCPMGERSYTWSTATGPSGKPTVQVNFPYGLIDAVLGTDDGRPAEGVGRLVEGLEASPPE